MLEATQLKERMIGADLVLTGEGKQDQQSAMGKALSGVGKIAFEAGVPAIAIAGSLGEFYEKI
jgi:glycerate kinase